MPSHSYDPVPPRHTTPRVLVATSCETTRHDLGEPLRAAGYDVEFADHRRTLLGRLVSWHQSPIAVVVIPRLGTDLESQTVEALAADDRGVEPGDVLVCPVNLVSRNEPQAVRTSRVAAGLTNPGHVVRCVDASLTDSCRWQARERFMWQSRRIIARELARLDDAANLSTALDQLSASAVSGLVTASAAVIGEDATILGSAVRGVRRLPFDDLAPASLQHALQANEHEGCTEPIDIDDSAGDRRTVIASPLLLGGRRRCHLVTELDRPTASSIELTRDLLAELVTAATPRLADFDRSTELRHDPTDWNRVVDRELFAPVFEPIVNLATLQTVGFAGDVRFFSGLRPDVALRRAARQGIGAELERTIVRQVCDRARALPIDRFVTVKVSSDFVRNGGLRGIAPDRPMTFELTGRESAWGSRSLARALAMIPTPHRPVLGDFEWVADEAELIERLMPDMVKTGPGLASEVDIHPGDRSLMSQLVASARQRNAAVIATGIDHLDELQTLAQLGVSLGQGPLFGEPREALEIVWRSAEQGRPEPRRTGSDEMR